MLAPGNFRRISSRINNVAGERSPTIICLTHADALRRMDERVRIPQVTSFISAVIQAERMGASLGSTFRSQADQRRSERFQQAEKLAMEAPVKLIFPLVAFIFPVTFLVLMFPIAVKFMQSGAF